MIWRAHDGLTRLGFVIGGAALFGIVAAYLVEVVARYMFNAPTLWSASAVAYLLCASTTLAMPELARTRGHIAINILEDRMPGVARARYARIVATFTGIVCAIAAWIFWSESIRQGQSGTTTSLAVRIPKVWVSAFICYGFTSTALYYIRAALAPRSLPWDDAPSGEPEPGGV